MSSSDPRPAGPAAQAHAQVVSDVWGSEQGADLDPDCSPTKVCRNARDFSFDGIAEEGGDLASSWRSLLDREGKSGTGSVLDLIQGPASGPLPG